MTFVDPVLRSYGQVLFARGRAASLLLLLATAFGPVGHGLVAVVVAFAATRWLQMPRPLEDEGLFGINALLVGLSVGSLGLPLLPGLGLAALGSLASVVVVAAWRAGSTLPPLTGPFLVVSWLCWAAAFGLGGQSSLPPSGLGETLGSLLFAPHPLAGALVAAAALAWSRQGAVMATAGGAVAFGLGMWLAPSLAGLSAVNGALVGAAVGGVWFVPSWASLALGCGGAAAASLVTVGLAPTFGVVGLPLFILPFNLVTWTLLLGLRLRSVDEGPTSVVGVPGTPEENLDAWQTRVARFGRRYWVRFRAPVLGAWTVTQSREDGPTHRGMWKDAVDLEVRDAEGQLHRGDGSSVRDYHCYRLPVVAMADGTVVRVVDGLPDQAVGEVDTDHNWGNVVVVVHGVGLYSLVAHLAPGSIAVVEGQVVRRGDELGRCGSSGRSPRPHLHVQLQAGPEPGAPTLPFELHDVVEEATSGSEVRSAWFPGTGDVLRNLDGEAPLVWVPGSQQVLEEGGQRHVLRSDIDLAGRRRLLDERGGELVFHQADDVLTVLEVRAERDSPLQVVAAALPRVPADGVHRLVWSDHLSPRAVLATPIRWLLDLVAPFVPWRGVAMAYERTREGDELVVVGRSEDGHVGTRARYQTGVGLLELEHTVGTSTRRLVRLTESES